MKVKEAPNKLYITYNGYGVFDEDSTVERTKDSQTEYNRTDAFIEKTEEYMYKQLNEGHTECANIETFLENYKNFMKGE